MSEIKFNLWSEETKVPNSKTVLRIPKKENSALYFSNPPTHPHKDLFNLSDDDKKEAIKNGKEALLSVWDIEMPFSEIKLRRKGYSHTDKVYAFKLPVEKINAIQSNYVPVEVHWSEIKNDEYGKLHAGIQGLHRKPGENKNDYKNLKDQLVLICKKHAEK